MTNPRSTAILALLAFGPAASGSEPPRRPGLRAGASAVDVSPAKLPAVINGGFLQATGARVNDPLFARCLVLGDDTTRLAIVVVDSCMLPRELLDRAKEIARERTGIPPDRVLISATHTHSAPAAMGALGCSPDTEYAETLPGRIAEAIALAADRLAPARAGWAVIGDREHTHCRRWVRRPDRLLKDPFGGLTVRANMHPGHLSPDVIGPSGPVDPGLTVLAVGTPEGRPVAVLANYSMHYFGVPAVSADYFGRFAAALGVSLGAGPGFVAMMSQGTSGDQQWMDYGAARPSVTVDAYADEVARVAARAYRSVAFRDDLTLAMAEATLTLRRRAPDEARLAWARPVMARTGDRPPRDLTEVYAREAVYLHERPERELKLQAVRVGGLGIAAIPNEVYALTGLKLKARSPLPVTFTIGLANGSEGYIPPPEQHALGGYTTWPARTAGLETGAEPKIVETVLGLLERVAGAARRPDGELPGRTAAAVLAAKPLAFWRMHEMEGSRATDAAGRGLHASYEGGVALYLDGPPLTDDPAANHCAHLAGGYLRAPALGLGRSFTIELWCWNGLPADARAVTGDLIAFGERGPRLSLAGSAGPSGRLVLRAGRGPQPVASGTRAVPVKTWCHLALVVDGGSVAVHRDGGPAAELSAERGAFGDFPTDPLFLGGDPGRTATWEGKLDEVAVFDRALSGAEIAAHARSRAAGLP
jgi:hypothetical protein